MYSFIQYSLKLFSAIFKKLNAYICKTTAVSQKYAFKWKMLKLAMVVAYSNKEVSLLNHIKCEVNKVAVGTRVSVAEPGMGVDILAFTDGPC